MKVALVQQIASTDRESNRQTGLDNVRRAAAKGADVVCFAEIAFERFFPAEKSHPGFRDLAETVPGPTTDAFVKLAAELGVVIILNLFEIDSDQTYDTSPVIDADGTLLGKTRMVHVPDYENFHERKYYAFGDRGAPVYETRAGKIGVAICYDRHYPEFMRGLALAGAELVVIPQAGAMDEWPAGLFEAEMRVAAFHNGYFTALCNRVGPEPKLEFSGESFVCDPQGCVVARAGKGTEEILVCDIDLEQIPRSHAKKLFLADRRPELYLSFETPQIIRPPVGRSDST